ncbi:hypothetical protein VTI74DRAFT_10482 [Chaetomium olivicolor]
MALNLPHYVYLFYNCYYMIEICKNARAFLASTRSQNLYADRSLDTGVFRVFGYDSSVAAGKTPHICPESDQSRPWRHDSQWFTYALQSGTTVNAISNQYDSSGNLVKESHIQYSCEEFPAASWVEGGDSANSNQPAFTRCAALTCQGAPSGTKAEQTWQSTAHGGSARKLKEAASDNSFRYHLHRRRRLTFNGYAVGVQIILDWGWIWKSITMTNTGDVGSAAFLDSSFTKGVARRVYSGDGTFSSGAKIGSYRAKHLAGDFIHVKDFGATQDGLTDDTAAFQTALYTAQGKIPYVDAGSYILTSSLRVPTRSKIVGEKKPKALLQVGEKGQIGNAELQDLITTAKGPTAGDVHVRIGGATRAGLTPDECPAVTSGVNANYNAASLMIHITPLGSGYFENMWLWLSDHDIESTLLYGTAPEHAVYYQYNFHNACNVFAAMIQTESPYYQPTPPPPAPFTKEVDVLPGDPDYNSSNISITGAGLCTWFSTYTQTCIDTQDCQKALVLLDNSSGSVRIQHLVTIGARYIAVMNSVGITAADKMNADVHPFRSQISVLDVTSDGAYSRPGRARPPPSTTPMITVSSGTWTSPITKAPLTLSEWRFQPVIITAVGGAGAAKKRQIFGDFCPVPAATSTWPAVVYNGPNGSPTTVAPTATVPTPPKGFWRPVSIRAVAGNVVSPRVNECSYYGEGCEWDSLTYGDGSVRTSDLDDFYDESWDQLGSTCPPKKRTTTSTTKPVYSTPKPSPRATPHHSQNQWNDLLETEDFKIFKSYTPSKANGIDVVLTFKLNRKCRWAYDYDECLRYLRYLHNPVDAYNCGGENGKQGNNT